MDIHFVVQHLWPGLASLSLRLTHSLVQSKLFDIGLVLKLWKSGAVYKPSNNSFSKKCKQKQRKMQRKKNAKKKQWKMRPQLQTSTGKRAPVTILVTKDSGSLDQGASGGPRPEPRALDKQN